ncbi:Lysophospholipase L1 [Duganella sp. CF517]|uniref:SGNH/GDSL hydrolase family protein n=1 Tax=Duganella sp. CF517 TaxID=1881038 RepID=UPI0008AE5762|nr:SGNH/GDSL hydrolase family protein [Duganella sp. CF517]SEN62713.1 Lysophospholipase L1 [Duganella sp. CF517]
MKTLNHLALTAALTLTAPSYAADPSGGWTTSWYASPQAAWGADFPLPTGVPAALERQTVRETARISAGGTRVRIVLSNRYGQRPIVIGEARVARAGAPADAALALSFGGKPAAVIPAGSPLISDPVDLRVDALEKLTVGVYLPQATPLNTFHWGAQQTADIVDGNAVRAATPKDAQAMHGRALLSAILVDASGGKGAVAVLGDSITDGNGSTPDGDRRWPDYLAARLSADGVAVVNAGISGARLLGDRMGVNAAARFEQDVLGQPGVKAVVVLLGINDIGWPQSAFAPDEPPMRAERMIAVYRQLIAQARVRGVRIVGATLLPFEGALHGTPLKGYYTPAKDAVRREVNRWIRDGGEFDAVVDFDKALRDPARPARMLPRYDSGDHLHPGDAGYEAMANEVAADVLP